MKALSTFTLAACLLLASCGQETESPPASARSGETAATPTVAATSAALPVLPPVQPRKLVRELDLSLIVRDLEAAATQVEVLATAAGGYVSGTRSVATAAPRSQEIVLRVPVERFDSVTRAVRQLAVTVRHEQLRSQDVTDRFVDLEARLKSLQLTEQEIRNLLEESKQRGYKIIDIMSLHRELTEIRARVEQVQGQINLLDHQAVLSTIRLTLSEDTAALALAPGGWNPGGTFRSSGRALVASLQFLANAAIVIFVFVLPVALLLLAGTVAGIRTWMLLRRFFPGRKPPPLPA